MQTEYAQVNVPDWFDKFQSVIQNQDLQQEEPAEAEPNNCEEWMILSDRITPFENYDQSSHESYDWQRDRLRYTKQDW